MNCGSNLETGWNQPRTHTFRQKLWERVILHHGYWITKSIKRWLKRKQRAYNKAIKSGKSEDWENFHHIRNKVKKATRKAYRKFIRNNSLASVKQFWSFIKSLKKKIPLELVTDSKEKAELLNMQYQSQFPQEKLSDLPTENESEIPSMPDIITREEGVQGWTV